MVLEVVSRIHSHGAVETQSYDRHLRVSCLPLATAQKGKVRLKHTPLALRLVTTSVPSCASAIDLLIAGRTLTGSSYI